jgi:pimeloyl-ACP methyl ester carboxylesterase
VPRTAASGVELEYDTFGERSSPALILISGGGAQLTFWQVDFCQRLVDRGFYVIRFDNRDVGLSSHLDHLGVPSVPAVREGREKAPYTLDDMALDTLAVLDAAGAAAAHVVGISLGGYIAQVIAINHPERVLSFTSIASGVGGRDNVYGNYDYALHGNEPPGPDATFEEKLEARLDEIEWMSTAQYFDRDRVREHVARSMRRAVNPAGVERQAAAVHAASSRAEALVRSKVPALIVHGELDPHLPVENAHRQKAAMPHARLVMIPDLAHDLPPQKWDEIIELVTEHARAAESGGLAEQRVRQ